MTYSNTEVVKEMAIISGVKMIVRADVEVRAKEVAHILLKYHDNIYNNNNNIIIIIVSSYDYDA